MPPFLMVDFSSLTLHFFVAKEMVLFLEQRSHDTDMHTYVNLLA